jgi:hypothetical protein
MPFKPALFLFPVPDRTADTLMAVTSNSIKPDSMVNSDCRAACQYLYTHQIVNYTIGFVDVRTGAHMNTFESTQRHVNVFLIAYNRIEDSLHQLAHYNSIQVNSVHIRSVVHVRKREPKFNNIVFNTYCGVSPPAKPDVFAR